MATELAAPVPMSTSDDHVLAEINAATPTATSRPALSDEEITIRFEIERTVSEIRQHQWRRVALQFPDEMLGVSARVYQMLARGLESRSSSRATDASKTVNDELATLSITDGPSPQDKPVRLTILADTSYGSCCVDEIAAEHIDADVVVHYGRTCLSPVSRLPVIYVYTKRTLQLDSVIGSFLASFPDKTEQVIIMADVPYVEHISKLCARLQSQHAYTGVFPTRVVRDTGSLIPNRTLPPELMPEAADGQDIKDKAQTWSVFHISNPPTALLLTLQSRVRRVEIYPTPDGEAGVSTTATSTNAAQMLRRRYALVTSLSTVSTWGILINTLSVKNYLHIVDHVKAQIARAGKKSYLFVVGKLNAAKVANFAEIGGWVVIGCWENSLVDSREFYRPIVTPYELELCLKRDEERVWTGEWRADFQGVLDQAERKESIDNLKTENSMPGAFGDDDDDDDDDEQQNGIDTAEYDLGSDDESAPPEFDLRTGRYISRTRPMQPTINSNRRTDQVLNGQSTALTTRANGDVIAIKGVASPAAEFLAQKRTWRGLGSDFEIRYEHDDEQGGLVQEGRTGIARGYTVGDSSKR